MTADLEDAPDLHRDIDVRRIGIARDLIGRFPPGRCADLACGTGLFAQAAASLGWQVTAMDARRRPWPQNPRITWLEQDVRDAGLAGYDLILCLGLLYHLELPDQLALLGKCAGTPLILDTHVSLTGTESECGYAGHYYGEGDTLLSSWRNERSFWPTEASLRDMLSAAGYVTVEVLEPWYHGEDRTFFTCRP